MLETLRIGITLEGDPHAVAHVQQFFDHEVHQASAMRPAIHQTIHQIHPLSKLAPEWRPCSKGFGTWISPFAKKKTQLFPSSCCIKSSAPQRRRTTLQLPSCLNLAWKGRGNFAKKSGHFYPSQVHPTSSDLFFRSSGSAARAFGFFAPAHGLPRASLESSKAWKKPWEECFWTNKFVEWFTKKMSISCSQVSARACANADCPHSTKNLSQCQVVSYVHSRYQQIIYTYSKISVLVSQTLIFLLLYGTNRLITAAPVVVDDWLFAAACRKCSTVASAAVGCCWDTKSGNLAQQPTPKPYR